MSNKGRSNHTQSLQPSGLEVRHQRPERTAFCLEHTSSREGPQSLLLALLIHLPCLRSAAVMVYEDSKWLLNLI